MKRLFGSIIDIRKGEFALTLFMFVYYYLLLVTYYFLKPARDSLFLVKLGAEQLPIVFMLIAVIVVPVTTFYSRASRSLKLNQLINTTTLVLIANLLILRALLELPHAWVFYVFYIWVSIYGVMSTSQFWLLANGVFDATQAKRLFVLFGLGGIIGAFTGGEVTSIFIKAFGVSTENLLFFCMGFLSLCILMVNAVWRIKRRGDADVVPPHRKKAHQKDSYAETLRVIKRSRHLLLIVGIIAMTMATASFIDFQFKTVSLAAFPTKQELTSFLGKFYGRLSLISFVFQLFISYRFLRFFGVGGAIMLLPLGLLGGTLAMLFVPGLVAGVLLRGADGVFKYSIDKTGRELLFLPVPLEVKKRTKIFIDMFVDRWFRGFAGGILLIFVTVLGFSVRQLSFVVLVLLAIWFIMVVLMRKEYVNAFRLALERREIDLNDLRVNLAESSTLNTLRNALGSKNERQILYALDLISDVRDTEIMIAVRPLLSHGSKDVRRKAITVLRAQGTGNFLQEMEDFLKDEDPMVRLEAMSYLCENAGDGRLEALERHLNSPDSLIASAAMICIANLGGEKEKRLIDEAVIERLLAVTGAAGDVVRSQVAEALGALNNPGFRPHLNALLDDASPTVIVRAMGGAGQSGDREFVPRLLSRVADKRYRGEAREALAKYGDKIVGTLGDHIVDETVDMNVRGGLCRVLSQIPTQHSVDTLVDALERVGPALQYYVIKALNRLRSRHPQLNFNHDALGGALLGEIESYYAVLQIFHMKEKSTDEPGRLLERALGEKIDQNLERMFRLLGLRRPPREIYEAYLGIIGPEKELRASAIEFLDNILKKDLKKFLFPIVDNIPVAAKIRRGRELFGLNFNDRTAALEFLINGRDPWLRACAIYSMREKVPSDLELSVAECRDDRHAVVREAARLVLGTT
jgi:ATP/ADP translocase/HEAT repeat protein